MGQIVEKTLETIGKTRGAYCQIVGAEISAHTCLTTQGQSGCFGCASSYRFCELCSERLVAVSAVGLCSACFKTEVKREQKIGKPSFPSGFKVRCQLLSRNIKTAMCEATQGQEGCRNCPAPSRLCEKCKERAVRFPRYGFCLHCSVAEFGGDEKQMLSDKEESQLREIRSKLSLKLPKTENGGGESKVFETSKPVAADSTQSDREKQEDRPQRVGERRVRFEGGRIKITLVAKKPDHFAELVDRAERLVKRHGYASTLFLERKLLITNGVAKKVLNSLEERGVVGPPKGTRPRDVIRKSAPRARYRTEDLPTDLMRWILKAIYEISSKSRGFSQDLYMVDIAAVLSKDHGDDLPLITPHWVGHFVRRMGLKTARFRKGFRITEEAEARLEQLFDMNKFHDQGGNKNQKEVIVEMPRTSRSRNLTKETTRTRENSEGDLVVKAKRLIDSTGRASALSIQRELEVDYPRATRVLNELERQGVVGPAKVGRPREILVQQTKIRRGKKSRASRRSRGKISKAAKLLPKVKEFVAGRETVNIRELVEHFGVSQPVAGKAMQLLEKEGMVAAYNGDRKPRKVLMRAAPTSESNINLRLPTFTHRIKRVEDLIQTLGKKTELGNILLSLIQEARELRSIRAKLKGLATETSSLETKTPD